MIAQAIIEIVKITPPPRNTIVECELRSLGLSMMLHLSAILKYSNSAASSSTAIIMYVQTIFCIYSFIIPASGTLGRCPKEPSAPHRDRLLISRPSLSPAAQYLTVIIFLSHLVASLAFLKGLYLRYWSKSATARI